MDDTTAAVVVAEQEKQKAILSLDIEGRGPTIEHGIISIGGAVGYADHDEVLETWRINLDKLGDQYYDQDCFDRFWATRQQLMVDLEKDAIEPLEGIRMFRDIVDSLDDKYELHIGCDNPAYDFAMIDEYLMLAGRPRLHYRADGRTYRPLYDFDSYARGALGLDYNHPWMSDQHLVNVFRLPIDLGEYTHYPEQDALRNYRLHVLLMQELHNRRSKLENLFDMYSKLKEKLLEWPGRFQNSFSSLSVCIDVFLQKLYDSLFVQLVKHPK
jgi:hypothetical protein